MSKDGGSALVGIKNHGWRVTFAGVGINLALGILYTWSVISKGIPAEWNWTEADKSLPYAVACLVFCLVMVPAGRMQDKIGPRIVATIGGLLVGLGMIIASFTVSPLGYVIGFGILTGAGIGFGYCETAEGVRINKRLDIFFLLLFSSPRKNGERGAHCLHIERQPP